MGLFSRKEPEPLAQKPTYDYVRERELVELGDKDGYLRHVGSRPLYGSLQQNIAYLVADLVEIMKINKEL